MAFFNFVFLNKSGINLQNGRCWPLWFKYFWERIRPNIISNINNAIIFIKPYYVYGEFHVLHPNSVDPRLVINKKKPGILIKAFPAGKTLDSFFQSISYFYFNFFFIY